MDAITDSNIQGILPLIIAVFSASILGSLHCAGMCGGLMFFAIGSDQKTTKNTRIRLQSAYHGGRLLTYTLLGIIAGFAGQALDFGGQFVGIQRAAMLFAGVMMVGFGIIALARIQGVKIRHIGVPRFLRKLIEHAQRSAFGLTPFKRAMTIGLLTAFLPCGWLYAFAFLAAGTANPIWGGITMAAFWMGTLPVMVSLGAGIQLLTGRLNTKLPFITAIAVIVVGVMTAMDGFGVSEITRASLGITDSPDAVPQAGEVDCPLCETAEPVEPDNTDGGG